MTYFTPATIELWEYIFNERLGMLDAVPGKETPEEIAVARHEANQAVLKQNVPTEDELLELNARMKAVERGGNDGADIQDYESFEQFLLLKYPYWQCPHRKAGVQ